TDPLGLTATHAGAPPAEASQAEASQAEASQAEVSQAEVSQAEASQAEVSQAEASQAEASPAWAQPAWATRPAADPPAPEPATAHQALTGQVLADAAPPEDRAPARQAPTHTPQEQTPFGQVLADAAAPSLIRVGMPEALARTIKGADTYAGVLTALASLPPAPPVPDAPGEVLVLAGELAHAMPIARQIVDQIGVEQTHLLLAGSSAAGTGVHASRVISGPAEAEKRAEKMQSAEAPWVVVLDAPIGATDPTWVRETCQALGATAVWAVVDATRKTADTARHLATLGDVEALVVHGVELTSDPATVLGLDLPIVSFDGQPATPHAWAAMLCARIAADVAPVAAAPRRRRPARKEQ
ncbi:MAG TPA: hypothetical protein VFO77_12095, partial [Actinoplanes sp.]|nr:hypothetical protein [Actinoplanes sp.]